MSLLFQFRNTSEENFAYFFYTHADPTCILRHFWVTCITLFFSLKNWILLGISLCRSVFLFSSITLLQKNNFLLLYSHADSICILQYFWATCIIFFVRKIKFLSFFRTHLVVLFSFQISSHYFPEEYNEATQWQCIKKEIQSFLTFFICLFFFLFIYLLFLLIGYWICAFTMMLTMVRRLLGLSCYV